MAAVSHDPLRDCIWRALETSHRHLALRNGRARRYPHAVAPFAAVEDPTPGALADLAELLSPDESLYILGKHPPDTRGLRWDGLVACLQMVFPEDALLPAQTRSARIAGLGCPNAQEMLDLITVAFPGYFRAETCRMGRYFGIRDADGHLLAMGGERLVLGPWREVSGLCSHPRLAGHGLGTALLAHILDLHRSEGTISWLHVAETNRRAIDLYTRLGFRTLRRVELHRLRRSAG